MNFLSWYVLLYFAFIAVGFILCVGSIFGADAEVDLDADADADAETQGGPLAWVLYALGSGSVPVGFALALSALLFGSIGLLSARILSGYLSSGWVGLLSILLAFGSVLSLGRRICLLLGRWFPTHEHHSVTPHTLVGALGQATSDMDAWSGYVGVYDDKGTYHVLKARALEGPICKGDRIVVAGYESESHIYSVIREPQ